MMKGQARRSGLVMGFDTHMIAGCRACSTPSPATQPNISHRSNPHYDGTLGCPGRCARGLHGRVAQQHRSWTPSHIPAPLGLTRLVFAERAPGADLAGLPELAVEELQEADARALLDAALTGPIDTRVRDQIVAETRGNPLALLELPRGLTAAELAGGFGLPGAI